MHQRAQRSLRSLDLCASDGFACAAECIVSADAHRRPSDEVVVCGLTSGSRTILNVLSAVTSAAMLM